MHYTAANFSECLCLNFQMWPVPMTTPCWWNKDAFCPLYLFIKEMLETHFYCKRIIYSVYDIWSNLIFLLLCVDFEMTFHSNQPNYTFINADLVMLLIWRMDTTAKCTRKNKSPNVIYWQHYIIGFHYHRLQPKSTSLSVGFQLHVQLYFSLKFVKSIYPSHI